MTAETENKPAETEEKKEEVKKEEPKDEEKSDKEKTEKEKPEKKEVEKEAKKEAAPKPTVHKADYQKDVVYLYQFTRTPVLPSLSPYCLKVETWLRLAGLKYENVDHRLKYRSKKGQLPFVEVNGEEIADSAIIVKELGQRYNTDLDTHLTPEQKNIAHANISMIENHFAWVLKYARSKSPSLMINGYKMDVQHLVDKPKCPKMLVELIFKYKIKRYGKKVKAHGLGVHTPEEIEEFGKNDLQVLSDLLGDKQFFFGESPTTLDVVAFSNVAQVAYMSKDVSYPLRDWMVEKCPNLVSFCDRMKERAFSDWDEMCESLDLNSHLPKPPKEEPKEEEKKEEDKPAEEKKDKDEKEKDEKEKDDSEKEKDNKEADKKDEKEEEKK